MGLGAEWAASGGSDLLRVGGVDAVGEEASWLHCALWPAESCLPPPTGPFSHLLPTYINSSESSAKIDAQKRKKKQTQQEGNRSGGAPRINLSLSLDESCCLYLELRTDGRTDGAETMLILWSAHLEITPRSCFFFYYSFCCVIFWSGGVAERRCSAQSA